jgi:Leucine-rich repeat (LRR) protein
MKNINRQTDAILDYETVKAKILNYSNADALEITSRLELQSLPSEIGQMKNLNRLVIYNCPEIEEIPEELSNVSELRSFFFVYCRSKRLPQNLGLLKNLRKLSLKGNNFNNKTDWAEMAQLQLLESLELSYSLKNYKAELPGEIFNLTELKFLYLDNNLLKKLPSDIAKLKSLLMLDLGHNYFTEFPEILLLLPHLETLSINAAAINCMPEELFDMPALKELIITGRDPKRLPYVTAFEKFFRISKQRNFEHKYNAFVIDLIKYPNQICELDEKELVSLLDCGLDITVQNALTELKKRFAPFFELNPLKSGGRIVMKGKTKDAKNRIKELLKSNDIETSVKITASTTHLVLGPDAAINQKDLAEFPKLCIITEEMLLNALQQKEIPFLLSERESKNDNLLQIRNLLESGHDANLFLAFELLRSGGIPTTLLTDLLIVYKETENPKVRKEVIVLIHKTGYYDFAEQVKKRLSLFGLSREKTLCSNLLQYSQFEFIDKEKLLQCIFKKTGKGIVFALLYLKGQTKASFFAKIIKDGFLNLSNLELEILPDDMEELGDLIKELDISLNQLAEFPTFILQDLPKLTVLSFEGNPLIKSFPIAAFAKSKSLKTLIAGDVFYYSLSKSDINLLKSAGIEFIMKVFGDEPQKMF